MADELILATDEDREGESISWHLLEVLNPKIPAKRMVFHEITKEAIQKSLKEFREIDFDMVKAQEARRILDRLVGYTISPLLWKKIAYGLSAGRVQSVAVRLISEREEERIRFVKSQYGSLTGNAAKGASDFQIRLSSYQDKKLAIGKDFDETNGKLREERKDKVVVLNSDMADKIKSQLQGQDLAVSEVEEKPVSRKPAPPFITSTLQQEANRKLGYSSRETMQVAQKLYEQGLITYMRTDSTFLSNQAIDAARSCIKSLYGKEYLPDAPRDYASKKAKGAQEAHEAIRPAGTSFVKPEDSGLSAQQYKLYDLIWKRTVASQMVNAEQKQVSIKFVKGDTEWAASGMTITFPGFLKAYVEGHDDPEQSLSDREVHLPQLKVGEQIKVKNYEYNDHETKPPARYTEASLVQKLEKEGVGRPSTYASIIGTIQDRGYVKKTGNQLQPTFTALAVSNLLRKHFPDYVDLNFTSEMENSLDEIAAGDVDWNDYLKKIYFGDEGLKNQVENKEDRINPDESRAIHIDGLEKYSFRVGKYGAYVCRKDEGGGEVCASLPEDKAPADISAEEAESLIAQKINGADSLGKDPKTGLPVYVLNGRYGPYVQLGDMEGEDSKPKRVSVPPQMDHENLSFEQALKLLSLPISLGHHPESGKEIKASLGRFGPYVVCDGDFRSIPKDKDLFSIDLKQALELLSQPKKGRGRATSLKTLGTYPATKESVDVFNGKYGPYIKCGKTNVSIPEDIGIDGITLEKAIELLASRMDDKAGAKKSSKKAGKKKATSKKTTTSSAKKTSKKSTSAKSAASAGSKSKTPASTKKKVVVRRKKS